MDMKKMMRQAQRMQMQLNKAQEEVQQMTCEGSAGGGMVKAVVRGDMSLVGPRPERDYYIRQIMDIAPYYSKLLQVRPGITSWGMVKYGYASTVFQMVERMRYDLMYINNCSIAVDLKILGFTVRTVLTGKGI